MRRLPSLTALRTFEAAARHAHFGRAAQDLCVTDSAVSHQIRQLEEQLGVTLFEREGRQVRPSAPARRLLHSLQQAFELILDACDELRDPGSQAQLRVAVTTELAQKWLVGRLADFAERHPQITLHLHEQPLEAQLPGAEMDLAIIYGTGPEDASGYFVRPLPTLQFFPVCSPGLFNQSPLKHPRDLARHCLLHDDQDGKTWNAWLATHAADLRPARHLYLGHAGLTMEAAARGQGVAIGDNLTSAEDLASGRLVRPFAAQVPSLGQYALVCERLRLDKPAVAQFVDWFSDQLADM
ncbi:LysR family transcriptional regulator [Pseudomonas otitidis]|uniref:LysR family transcriptional regulator n=1 Tax=Metapseudomonas otitidis TaxID=319939 RepID=A0A7X3HDW1_9GAMM|nr:LysR substrate-binding domain-containing protein [Pseudomonas otitidis]MWK59249.1 LysR family transcriptional regulator [Pseudomonas otitidis]